jgi:pimeloyl-ACP methyl ester carboxylesterase
MRHLPILAVFACLLSAVGCATSRHETRAPIPVAPPGGIVYSVDGAGSFFSFTSNLSDAIAESRLPLRVEPVNWSHGYGRILSDHLNYENIREEGCRLAARIALQKQAFPDTKVHLIAHSAGAAVLLAATEHLPPGSVEHIVLVAPAVAADYDLRPAVRAARCGMDVFYSELDLGFLGVATGIFGNTDRTWTAAAGRVGFRPVVCDPADAQLYQRLRQHPWHPCMSWTGNRGGHFGGYRSCYLQRFVLPVLLG